MPSYTEKCVVQSKKFISRLKPKAQDNWLAIEDEVKKWLSNKGNTDRKIRDYRAMI